MKLVIFGAKGMLGTDLRKAFDDQAPYVLDKDELDITNREAVLSAMEKIKPDVIINAAAYTDVDGCEINRELAMKVNGASPGYLAEGARNIGARLVHYSTDYVFDGKKSGGYREDDEPGGPLNFYGESKLAGERVVKEMGGKYYLIRTSWLFGLHGKNFVDSMIKLSQEKKELRVVNDQHGKPTFSFDLAKKTRELLEKDYDFGIYHIVNEPETTWYDFACKIINNRGLTSTVNPCASAEFPRPAKRPEYSTLLNTKLPPLRQWQEALREYLQWRQI